MDHSHAILERLRTEAQRKREAALERAERAQREAERYAIEMDAYARALSALDTGGQHRETAKEAPASVSGPGSSDKWLAIYAKLHSIAEAPYSYDDIASTVASMGHAMTTPGLRTQMMNAVNAGIFERPEPGKFKFTKLGLDAIGVGPKESEPPEGDSPAGGRNPRQFRLTAADPWPHGPREEGD